MKPNMFCVVLSFLASVAAADPPNTPQQKQGDLFNMNLQDVMQIQVTTASRKSQPFSSVPAAIYVITQEDIRRSGLTSIPDLLRLAPGMQVSNINSNRWAVSARGFNFLYSSELLVLVDGRSVYTNDFSGVYWDAQDTMLEDIDRIEVIRGPNAALWGDNAVNGVINIITKHSKDTHGRLAVAEGGTLQQGMGEFRQGDKWGKNGNYRIYGKYSGNAPMVGLTGNDLADGWNMSRLGFRYDGGDRATASGEWMTEAELYSSHLGESINYPVITPPYSQRVDSSSPQTGYHIVTRWETQSNSGADTRIQTFLDHYTRVLPEIGLKRDTVDMDLQHQFERLGANSFLAGLDYRRSSSTTQPGLIAAFMPPNRTDLLYSAFVQDEITFSRLLHLTLGSRLSHNDYTGYEIQPNARLSWTPNSSHIMWAAVSRAVQTSGQALVSANERSQAFPTMSGLPALVTLSGNPNLKAVSVTAHELGVRQNFSRQFFIDVAGFYNVYRRLVVTAAGMPIPELGALPPYIEEPVSPVNGEHGETWGVEVSSRLTATSHWRLMFSYSYIDSSLRPDSAALRSFAVTPTSYKNQIHVRSYLDLPHNLELDTATYYVDRLTDGTPAYLRIDLRLGWHAKSNLEFSLDFQNLFDPRHREFTGVLDEVATDVPRSMYGKATYRF